MNMNTHICIDSETFEIEDSKKIIAPKLLAEVISILNKKGYYIDMFSVANILKAFSISELTHNLIEKGLLEINEETKQKIKEVISASDYEESLIIFKDDYKFDTIPEGFKIIGSHLYYPLSVLKEGDDISFKSLLELDEENRDSLKRLLEWAKKLPDNNVYL